ELLGLAAGIAEGGLRALLHHVAELPGQGELPLTWHQVDLDKHRVAAGRGPGHAGRYPHFVFLAQHISRELWRPNQLDDLLAAQPLRIRLALGNPAGHLAADFGYLALQVTHARFIGVFPNQKLERLLLKTHAGVVQPVAVELARDEETAG